MGRSEVGNGTAEEQMGLVSALGLGAREHIAVVGGGGKTSFCFTLAGELFRAGNRVITSTTTKVREMEADRAPRVLFLPPEASSREVGEHLGREGHIFVARGPAEPGKIRGISRATADSLFRRLKVDYLIVEADGAAGMPIKAPAAHEPVIPRSTTMVAAVAGLEALGSPLGRQTVFRPKLFGKVTGLEPGEIITPEAFSRVFLSPQGLFKGSPDKARRVVFLNKLDLLSSRGEAMALGLLLLGSSRGHVERVVAGSLLNMEYFAVEPPTERGVRGPGDGPHFRFPDHPRLRE